MIPLKVHLVKIVQFRLALLKETKNVKDTVVYQRKGYSHYKYKKHNNVTSKEIDHLDEVFRTGSRWKTKMKFFQLYRVFSLSP